ncbi:MAG: hypothetical protein KDK37_10695 [Leptospiraceae bacterium]|nr:hypothetical protein [Leptospiraceae bacterium]MCB1304739.1 hypothetical protein [Leptospiraceae bacterium]
MTGLRDPFLEFSAQSYLSEYYRDIGEENQFILNFLHETYRSFEPQVIFDIGGGPTIYQVISASRHAHQIYFFEYLPANRQAVQDWIDQKSDSFDWSPYFLAVAEREGSSPQEVEARMRKAVVGVFPCNLFETPPLKSPNPAHKADLISSHFCVESITSDAVTFENAWKNLMEQVPGKGKLVMSLLKNATTYRAGDSFFPAYPVEETDLKSRLESQGFKEIHIESIAAEDQRDYEGIICLRARRS